MNLLDRYVARTILAFTLLVTAVLLVLGSLFTFIGQQDDIGIGSYDTAGALLFTALNVPDQVSIWDAAAPERSGHRRVLDFRIGVGRERIESPCGARHPLARAETRSRGTTRTPLR